MVIFGAGVITGGLLVKKTSNPSEFRQPKPVARTNQLGAMPGQIQRMDFLLRARNELSLTPQQHERIETIIAEGQEKSRKLWESVVPEMKKELQAVHEKIRNELNPEQRRRFEALLKNTRPNSRNPDTGLPPPERQRERMRPTSPGERAPDSPPPSSPPQ